MARKGIYEEQCWEKLQITLVSQNILAIWTAACKAGLDLRLFRFWMTHGGKFPPQRVALLTEERTSQNDYQSFNPSTIHLQILAPFNPSTLKTVQPFDPSTLQPFNRSTFPPFNSSLV